MAISRLVWGTWWGTDSSSSLCRPIRGQVKPPDSVFGDLRIGGRLGDRIFPHSTWNQTNMFMFMVCSIQSQVGLYNTIWDVYFTASPRVKCRRKGAFFFFFFSSGDDSYILMWLGHMLCLNQTRLYLSSAIIHIRTITSRRHTIWTTDTHTIHYNDYIPVDAPQRDASYVC